jgi:hypothetical protein
MTLKKITLGIIGLALVLTGCPTPAGGNGNNSGGGTSLAPWTPEYAIGGTGPGGGKIFYISHEGFINAYDGSTCHYLEVAPNDSGSLKWITQGYDSVIVGAIMVKIRDEMGWDEAEAIGMGRKNTQAILAHDPTAPAASACVALNAGGKSDWFLPSMDELNQLRIYKKAVGITDDPAYWSSSMYTFIEAQYMDFKGGIGNYSVDDINESYLVRAIRAF